MADDVVIRDQHRGGLADPRLELANTGTWEDIDFRRGILPFKPRMPKMGKAAVSQ